MKLYLFQCRMIDIVFVAITAIAIPVKDIMIGRRCIIPNYTISLVKGIYYSRFVLRGKFSVVVLLNVFSWKGSIIV